MSPIMTLATKDPVTLKEPLEKSMEQLRSEGFLVDVHETQSGDQHLLLIQSECPAYPKKVGFFSRKLALFLSESVFNVWQTKIVKRYMRQVYYYLSPEEREVIISSIFHSLEEEDPLQLSHKKEKVYMKLLECFERLNELNIDGFVNFRLKDLRSEIENLVDHMVDDFLMEKEYYEFIRLLRYFVEAQEPKAEKVHVLLKPNGIFQLYDAEEDHLEEGNSLEGFVVDVIDNDLNYEDVLISTLITIAPKKIVLHNGNHSSFTGLVKNVKGVFGDRVNFCPGCSWCLKIWEKKF